MAKVASKANQSQGMLVFKLTLQQNFAIGTLKVREIVPYMPTTKIPYSHHHVIGTVTIRDLTVPVIDMAADRAPFIDQTQSMNLWLSTPTFGKVNSMHMYAWKKGLKTGMYYLRSRSAVDAVKVTVSSEKVAKEEFIKNKPNNLETEDCLTCSA